MDQGPDGRPCYYDDISGEQLEEEGVRIFRIEPSHACGVAVRRLRGGATRVVEAENYAGLSGPTLDRGGS